MSKDERLDIDEMPNCRVRIADVDGTSVLVWSHPDFTEASVISCQGCKVPDDWTNEQIAMWMFDNAGAFYRTQ